MSQSESPLRAVIANIVTPAHTECVLPCLAELADHAFALADQGISTKNRQARILYSTKDGVGPLPIKVVLFQDVPAVEIQRVAINLQTNTVQCEGRPSLPIEMRQIERVRQEIKLYLQSPLKNPQRIPERKLVHSAWQDFLKRLELNGISFAQPQVCADPPFPENPCPSCEVSTTLCISCRAVICLSWDCPVSRLIPFQSCSRNNYVAACLPCLQNARTIPRLGQCPKCNLWFCDDELTWCLGRPKETPNQTPCNTIYGISSSDREHPPKPITCSYCDLGLVMSKCSNPRCWSREGYVKSRGICQSCSPAGGVSCACEDYWICDDCKEAPMADCFTHCPQCKRAYCVRGCEYIRFCIECGRPTLCDDCEEEDRSSFAELDGPEVQVELVSACQTDSCWNKFCKECLGGQRCANCKRKYCGPCWWEGGSCRSCSRHFCEECEKEQYCNGCGKTYCDSCREDEYCIDCSNFYKGDREYSSD